MLRFYFAANTCALAPHIVLEEVGADYTAERIDFAAGEQRGESYLKVNPKGRVPALVTDRGILTETPAILLYLAQCHPQAALAPLDDAFELARAQAFNSYLCATVHVAHAHKMRGHRWVDDEEAIAAMRRKVPETVTACFALIEEDMLAGPWVLGERYSICDAYLFTLARWLEGDGIDPATLPRVLEHRNRVAERPAVQRALAGGHDHG